jgi:hypothetical protein
MHAISLTPSFAHRVAVVHGPNAQAWLDRIDSLVSRGAEPDDR